MAHAALLQAGPVGRLQCRSHRVRRARAARPTVLRVCAQQHAEQHSQDYYELLGVERTALPKDIKVAYHQAVKLCHPDVAGHQGHEMAILLNKAYRVLSDRGTRAAYDSGRVLFGQNSMFKDFNGRPLSKTMQPNAPQSLFVDETKCVGCMACVHEAPNTFIIEDDYGRARVDTQWADEEMALMVALEVCPVDCIHLVPTSELAVLEWVHRSQPRNAYVQNKVDSKGATTKGVEECPFVASERFKRRWREMEHDMLKAREKSEKEAEVAQAVRRATRQSSANALGSWWPFNQARKQPEKATVSSNVVPCCPLIKKRDDAETPLALPSHRE